MQAQLQSQNGKMGNFTIVIPMLGNDTKKNEPKEEQLRQRRPKEFKGFANETQYPAQAQY